MTDMVTQKTFRLCGIPKGSSKEDVKGLVKRALKCTDDVDVQVRSLAEDPSLPDDSMMATLEFSTTPEELAKLDKLDKLDKKSLHKVTIDDHDLEFDSKFMDFTALHTPENEDPTIDVVAVSGLNAHAFGSFKDRNSNFMWLRDGLARDLPQSRILVYALDTDLVDSESFQNISDLGKALRTALKTIRKESQRPLVLIGHSLGGIVVKEAINLMAKSLEQEHQATFHALAGVLFFGVPSQGMVISSMVAMVGNGPNRALIEALGPNSHMLSSQSQTFLEILNSDVAFHVVSFYETKMSPTAVQDPTTGRWAMTGPTEILVNPFSATNGRIHDEKTTHNHGINSSHSDLVKFTSRRDGNYRAVIEHLKKMQGSSGLKRGGWDLAFTEQYLRVVQLNPAAGTCEWLLHHNDLQSWLFEPCGLLWIRGKPGSGKSMAMKTLLQHMRYTTSLNTFVASFFIQGTGSPLQKTPLGLYRSLLHQLYQEYPSAFMGLTQTFQRKTKESGDVGEKWDWTTEELFQRLSHGLRIASQQHSIAILIDALDEAGEELARKIVEAMKSLLSSVDRSAQLRICFSCRHYPQITLEGGRTIVLEDWNTDDISQVVNMRLEGSNLTPKEKHLLQERVFANSDGVFQWASLVLDTIIHFKTHGRAFTEILKMAQEVPTDLHRLYKSLLQPKSNTSTRSGHDVHEQQRTLKLFQWVLFAARPLAPIELQQALVLDWRMTQEWITEYQAEDDFIAEENLALRVKSLSRGLIHMSGSFLSGQVQFIHQSVPDLLTGPTNVLQSLSPHSDIPMAWLAQFQLSRSCLKYLLMGEIRERSSTESFLDWLHKQYRGNRRRQFWKDMDHEIPNEDVIWNTNQDIVKHSFQRFPFILYAWRYWALHAESAQRQSFETPDEFDTHDPLDAVQWSVEPSLKSLCKELTSALGSPTKPYYDKFEEELVSTHLGSPIWGETPFIYRFPSFNLEEEADQMVHILAYCGLNDCIGKLAKSRPALLEDKDIRGYHALSYAIEGKQQKTVLMLLRAGSDLNVILEGHILFRFGPHTPLCLACIWGDAEVISRMIKAGAKVNPEGCAMSPLFYAALTGYKDVIDMLISVGANVNGEKEHWSTPLHALANNSEARPDVVSQLMNNGARIDMLDRKLQNPLHISVKKSPMPVFRAFLKEAVALEEKYKYRTRGILSTASKSLVGCEKVPCIINGQDQYGQSPIFHAAMSKDCERLRLLHEAGADINAKIYGHRNDLPLFHAVIKHGFGTRRTTLDLLLQYGADVNTQDYQGRTPITEAAKTGNVEMAAFLLKHGAKINARDNYGRTPIALAVKKEDVEMVAFLFEHGAEINTKDNRGCTPILKAARRGNVEMALFLLEHGAEINTKDHKGMTPLLGAVKELELKTKRRVTLTTNRPYPQLIELLIKFGADVHSVNNSGKNALFYVREKTFECVITSTLLQEAGLREVVGETSESESELEDHEPESDSESDFEPDFVPEFVPYFLPYSVPKQEQEIKQEHEPEHSITARSRFLRGKDKIEGAVRKWVDVVGKRPAR